MTSVPPLQMERARVVLGGHTVLDGIDFRLEEGEFVVLLGANGSGKTTLIRALMNLVPIAGGELRVFGESVTSFRLWRRIGYVPQRFTAMAGVPATVTEVVVSGRIGHVGPLRRYGKRDQQAVRRALDIVDLGRHAKKPVAALSGGQQQRVLIARALATEPDLLVLDEPVSGVDVETQVSLAGTLSQMHSEGHSVLLVAHALGVMEPLVGRAVVLDAGRVAYDGPPREQHVYTEHVHHHPHEDAARPSPRASETA
ncbi:metal ABC transporter ATP-binding protein [soil metagenome]